MRAMLCGCGERLEAANDDGLVHATLEHYRWVHGMAVVDGEGVRQVVQQGAYDSGESSVTYVMGADEDLWSRDLTGRSDVLTHTYEGYGGDAMWSEGFDTG